MTDRPDALTDGSAAISHAPGAATQIGRAHV